MTFGMIDYDELLRDIAERVGAERSQASMARVRVTSRLDARVDTAGTRRHGRSSVTAWSICMRYIAHADARTSYAV